MAESRGRHLQVAVLGGAAMDLVAEVETLPQRDGISLARSYECFPGGSAANVAVGLARLGCSVGFLGKLGDDAYGRALLASFADEGVDTGGVIVEAGRPSAVCFIAVDAQGERIIVALPGAAVIERPEELALDSLRGVQALYVGPSLAEVAIRAAAAVQENGGAVFYAPGAVEGCQRRPALDAVLECSDVLVVSRAEALVLTGCEAPDAAAGALREMGATVVVQTLGGEGALVAEAARLTRVPAFEVPHVKDTTGAGDAFAAGLVAGFLDGLGWEGAARMGCATAALKIGHLGARSGLPGQEPVLALMGGSSLPPSSPRRTVAGERCRAKEASQ
jgi:ribokinase